MTIHVKQFRSGLLKGGVSGQVEKFINQPNIKFLESHFAIDTNYAFAWVVYEDTEEGWS